MSTDAVLVPEVSTTATHGKSSHLWFHEWNTPHYGVIMSMQGLPYQGRSKFQGVQIMDTHEFGLSLVLDGMLQSTSLDEFIYHESLCHPALLMHDNPKKVFIGGGGEGCTAREVLRHTTVERLVMCDIDEDVVQFCKKEMPNFHAGALDDPRIELVYQDAYAYLADSDEQFDVIILDFCDPLEGGPAFTLYTQEFYSQVVAARLATGGIMVTQAGPCDSTNVNEVYAPIYKTVQASLGNACGYDINVPSFGSQWGFAMALPDGISALDFKPDEIDHRIQERIDNPDNLRYYDGITHAKLFNQTKCVRDAVHAEQRLFTQENPVYIFS